MDCFGVYATEKHWATHAQTGAARWRARWDAQRAEPACDRAARNIAVGLLAVGIHAAWDPGSAVPKEHSLHRKRPEVVLRAAGLWRDA